MATISRFRGIAIRMFFDEGRHGGRPHFHAAHAGVRASFDIATLGRLNGRLPPNVERLVRVWAGTHQAELLANWERGRLGEGFEPIDPLK